MKRKWMGMMLALSAGWLCQAAVPQFESGVKLEADGKVIDDGRVGHLVPVVTDWNNDGKKDLLVGQFSGGLITLYLNEGTDAAPVFGKGELLQAGGKDIHLQPG